MEPFGVSFQQTGLEKKNIQQQFKQSQPDIFFPFPSLKYTSVKDDTSYYFDELICQEGYLYSIVGTKGKTLYFEYITGRINTNNNDHYLDHNLDRGYLRYKIAYCPQINEPKSLKRVSDIITRCYNNNHQLIKNVKKFEDKYIKELNYEEKICLSFMLLLNEKKDIYIFDYDIQRVCKNTRLLICKIFSEFIKENNVVGMIVEDNADIINNMCDRVYYLNDIDENYVYGREYASVDYTRVFDI